MDPIRFTDLQRSELQALGLIDEVLHELEVRGLPTASRLLTREPARGDVLAELQSLEKSLRDAQAAVMRILTVSEDVAPHAVEARRHLLVAGPAYGAGVRALFDVRDALTAAVGVAQQARSRAPRDPLRHRAASHRPVEAIHECMQLGRLIAGRDSLPKSLRPSASPTSPFRRIVGICYEAIDAPTADPERAIKAYVKRWKPLAELEIDGGVGTERHLKT
jgi:hypothetical protein